MKYPKLSLLFICNFLLTVFFLFGIYWFNKQIIEAYIVELDKNLQLSIINQNLSDMDKLTLKFEANEKKQNFRDKLHYMFVMIVIAVGLFTILKNKTEEENKRLDFLEKDDKRNFA